MRHHHTKILLVGVLALFAASGASAEMKTTLGGTANFQAGYTDQDSAFDAGTRHQGFRNDTEVTINVENAMDAGAKYGATIELEGDVTADARGEGLNADKTFLWFEGGFGRLELGNNADVAQTMVVNAASIARATGGINGDDEFFIHSTGSGLASFIVHPDLPSAFIGGIAEDATKIAYYTPVWSGFQLGLNYTPDQGDGGQSSSRYELDADYENVFDLGLSYHNEFNGVQLGAALVGEIGDGEDFLSVSPAGLESYSRMNDLRAWQAGVSLGYQGFSVAGSYADWDDSMSLDDPSLDPSDADFWTLGIAYAPCETWGVSATYLDSDNSGDEYQSLVLGADYSLAPGLTPYVEWTFFEADEEFTTTDNDGTVLLVGSYLNF